MSDEPVSGARAAPAVSVVVGRTSSETFGADERMLRSGRCAVSVTVLSELSVSYGVGVRESAPFLARARAEGIPVARRTSGGSGVLHAPGDLAWSVVLPKDDPRVGQDFVRAYGRFGAGVVRFLAGRDLAAEWSSPPDLAPDYCVLSGRGQVLSVRGQILGGAAQHVSRSALLHQGMLFRDVDRARVARLFSLSEPAALGRLVGLGDLGVTAPPEELARGLARCLAEGLGVGSP
ncbi:MAG: hypothetical protein WBE40_05950 [Thermoplasmata archaeon]